MSAILQPTPPNDPSFENGIEHQYILIRVHVATSNRIIQYDDSCAHLISSGLRDYNGVLFCRAEPLYKHCKEDRHIENCQCGECEMVRSETQQKFIP